jgi:hypothetical protein
VLLVDPPAPAVDPAAPARPPLAVPAMSSPAHPLTLAAASAAIEIATQETFRMKSSLLRKARRRGWRGCLASSSSHDDFRSEVGAHYPFRRRLPEGCALFSVIDIVRYCLIARVSRNERLRCRCRRKLRRRAVRQRQRESSRWRESVLVTMLADANLAFDGRARRPVRQPAKGILGAASRASVHAKSTLKWHVDCSGART